MVLGEVAVGFCSFFFPDVSSTCPHSHAQTHTLPPTHTRPHPHAHPPTPTHTLPPPPHSPPPTTTFTAAITTATRALNQLQQSVEEDRAAEIQATQAILNDFESQQKALSQEKEAANVALTDAQNQLSECTALLRKAQNELYEKEDAVDKEKQELKKWDADIGNLKRRQRGGVVGVGMV